jgi:hypothetical protein
MLTITYRAARGSILDYDVTADGGYRLTYNGAAYRITSVEVFESGRVGLWLRRQNAAGRDWSDRQRQARHWVFLDDAAGENPDLRELVSAALAGPDLQRGPESGRITIDLASSELPLVDVLRHLELTAKSMPGVTFSIFDTDYDG